MKLPEGLIDLDGARLFGMKDIEIIVRDCAQVCMDVGLIVADLRESRAAKELSKIILKRYGIEP